jgi:hypothetical protein
VEWFSVPREPLDAAIFVDTNEGREVMDYFVSVGIHY